MLGQPLHVAILVVRPWSDSLDRIRSVLRAAGFEPTFHQVDFEPALHAALTRGGYDVVVYDPASTGLSRAAVQACIDTLRPGTPLVVIRDPRDLGRQIAAVLEARRN
jgi:hypothetical protein